MTARLPASLGAPEPLDAGRCRLRTSCTDSLEWVALRLALVDCEFTVNGPPAMTSYLHDLGERLTRATARRAMSAGNEEERTRGAPTPGGEGAGAGSPGTRGGGCRSSSLGGGA